MKRFIKKFIILKRTLRKTNGVVVLYNKSMVQEELFRVVKLIHDTGRAKMALNEMYQLATLAKSVKAKGPFLDIGTYKGASARIIGEVTKQTVHCFDTFDGLPEDGLNKDLLWEGKFKSNVDEVRGFLSGLDVVLCKGLFPQTAQKIERIAFANLDLDTYTSTKEAIEFLYPRMVKGGMLLIHDYLRPLHEDVLIAVNEYMKDKPEPIVEIGGSTQCLINKL